jgi:NTP pyrophosphatase (non-canonical NTP hydrolase)
VTHAQDTGIIRRDLSFTNLDVFQAEVKEWSYRNFGSPDDGRTVRLEALFEAVRNLQGQVVDDQGVWVAEIASMVMAVEEAPNDAPSWVPLLGSVEELGELAHAHIKGYQGIRHTPEEIEDKKKDAVGDVLVYLADYCNREGVTMAECLFRAWGEVRERDWQRNHGNGKVT